MIETAKKKKYKSSATGRSTQGSRTFNGEKFNASTQHDTKKQAKARAEKIRESGAGDRGLNARVIKQGKKWIVYVGGYKRSTSGWGYAKRK